MQRTRCCEPYSNWTCPTQWIPRQWHPPIYLLIKLFLIKDQPVGARISDTHERRRANTLHRISCILIHCSAVQFNDVLYWFLANSYLALPCTYIQLDREYESSWGRHDITLLILALWPASASAHIKCIVHASEQTAATFLFHRKFTWNDVELLRPSYYLSVGRASERFS